MDPRRRIPAVDALLETPPFEPLIARYGRPRAADALRATQTALREELGREGGSGPGGVDAVDRVEEPAWHAERVRRRLERETTPSLRRVVNATGVVLHTNLGRAPLPAAARGAVADVAGAASLEYELDSGLRGSRYVHCAGLLKALTGAEGALVVNNGAAAVVLALNTLAREREVVISRGELVEIGGSFRIPEIMARSGAIMREVGATNRTHVRDYQEALEGDPALILKVHRSNFRVEGFTAEVQADELSALARAAGVPLLHDLGSGALADMTRAGLPKEMTAAEAIEAGADVITMSGDKLLGGPQAGIILGRADLVERMRTNPLCRALRCDKLTLAALEATLSIYRDRREWQEVPTLRMLAADRAELRERAERWTTRLRDGGVDAAVVAAVGAVGGGAYPGVELPGIAVAIRGPAGATKLARRLRDADPPIVGRIVDERVLLHPRTVPDEVEQTVLDGVLDAMSRPW